MESWRPSLLIVVSIVFSRITLTEVVVGVTNDT